MSRHPPKKFRKTGSFTPVSKNEQMDLLKKAVMDTLRYRQIFDCPMSYFQIWNYLIGGKNTVEGNLEKELDTLLLGRKVAVKDGLYSLNRPDYEKAEKRRKRAEKLIIKARHITRYLKKIPWIEMIAVTGSVAAYNAEERDDIDMFIVTKPKRLFISRFFTVLILKTLGVYWNSKKPAGTVCPNIFLTADNLIWEKSKQNLFTANEVALLYPLFQRHNCYFDFLKCNSWATHYLPNLHIPDYHARKPKDRVFTEKLVDLTETVLMKFQMKYMQSKKTTEVVKKDFIHFNTHDTSDTILQKYNRIHS